jgi:hypothetical protein
MSNVEHCENLAIDLKSKDLLRELYFGYEAFPALFCYSTV